MSIDLTPAIMFILLLVALAAGIPIAFALGLIALVSAYFLWGYGGMALLISAAWGTMNNFILIAIPLFIFMAMMLERSGVIADLYDCFYKWSGPVRGGLAVATILVGTVLGAVSGVVAAGVIGLGVIALPQMLSYKYQRRLSAGSVLAGGTLGQLIPPSINMVIYGAVVGVSVGGLFAGGVTTGLMLAALFCVYILVRAFLNKDLCPSLPPGARATWREKFASLKQVILPTLLIVLVLGAILSGAATPTEAAAVGALGAIIFSLVTRRIRWSIVKESAIRTVKLTSMIGWIIIGASAFGAVFAGVGGKALIARVAMSMPGGRWGVLTLSVVFILFLGMFLETAALIMLAAPMVSPLVAGLGFDPLWWGLVFMVALQAAFLSPPFGFALFYLKGVAKDMPIEEIYLSGLPFLGLQLLGLALVIIFPPIALWLPNMLLKLK